MILLKNKTINIMLHDTFTILTDAMAY